MEELKACSRCKVLKSATLDNFGFNKQRNKLKPHCKECGRKASRERYSNNRDEICLYDRINARERYKDPIKRARKQVRMRNWFAANPEKREEYAKSKKIRAASNKNPLTQEWVQILLKDPCFYCGNSCESIDHVTPVSRNGTDDVTNIMGVCKECNSSKKDKNLFEFLIAKQKEYLTVFKGDKYVD